jgi:hypothetical protein
LRLSAQTAEDAAMPPKRPPIRTGPATRHASGPSCRGGAMFGASPRAQLAYSTSEFGVGSTG